VQDGTGGTENTTIAITGATATAGSATFNLAVVAGDLISLQQVPTNQNAGNGAGWSICFEPTTVGESIVAGSSSTPSTSVVNYHPIVTRSGLWQAGTGDISNLGHPTSFVLRDFYLRAVQAAPGAGNNWVLALQIDGAASGVSITLADTAQDATDLTNEATITEGQEFRWQSTPTSTPTASAMLWSAVQFIGEPQEVEFDDPSGDAIGLTWTEAYHVDANGDDEVFVDAPVDPNDDATTTAHKARCCSRPVTSFARSRIRSA
jgi:hypothetical protein